MSQPLPDTPVEDALFVRRSVEAAIRIGVLFLLVMWSLQIMRPFITIVLWGVIIAVAVFPAYNGLANRLGGRRKLTAALLVIVALAALLIPSVKFFGETIDSIGDAASRMEAGTLTIPPPSEKVADWPFVGERLHETWTLASTNLEEAVARYQPQLTAIGRRLLAAGAGLGLGVLQFVISIIIAGVFLTTAGSGKDAAVKIGRRFAGEDGAQFAILAERTIRSVALGVLGVALIQSTLSAIGMVIVGVPAAGMWALLVLIVAIIQLPPILILGPVAVYVFSVQSTGMAVFFLIWAIVVSGSDAILKPMLLGRGVNVPVLVILIGAIGGMVMSGIIGLFVGAVVLALAYQLFVAWLSGEALTLDDSALDAPQIDAEPETA
jgi:predicted PurR-regulated permease PerM